MNDRLKQVEAYIGRMPSLSTTVAKVLDICNRPDTSPNDLNRVIALDPVLTGRVLHLINSAYYSLPDEVTSLTRAIIVLGVNTVKNLALSTAILEALSGGGNSRALSMDEFWTHSIGVGVIAKSLAAMKGVPAIRREEYFVAGLLHDLGKIPLNVVFPEDYRRVVALLEEGTAGSSSAAEEQILGLDHARIGALIADKWKQTEAMREVMRCHHTPSAAKEEWGPIVTIVGLADDCHHLFRKVRVEDGFPSGDPRLARLWEEAGMDAPSVAALRDAVSEEIERAKIFLSIAGKG
ncbi:MAG: HDOD domain-containing protein [Syntrophaceae bacterium]|nr:HDOD domain-containing protein [Syntrophaceae bacterium]